MTHQFFDSDKINWDAYIASQQVGQGYRMSGRGNLEDEGNKEFFKGLRYVRGYGIGSTVRGALGSVGRFLLPIATNIIESVGQEADDTIGRIGSDIVKGQPLLESIREQSKRGLSNVGTKIQQCGKGKRGKVTKKPKIIPYVGPQTTQRIGPANYRNLSNPKQISRPNHIIRKPKKPRDYLDLD
jgi:hypothetical protein